jgi:hypothetical protein
MKQYLIQLKQRGIRCLAGLLLLLLPASIYQEVAAQTRAVRVPAIKPTQSCACS